MLRWLGSWQVLGLWATRVLLAGLGCPPAPVPWESGGAGLLFWKFSLACNLKLII